MEANAHEREEEFQWARILAKGDSAAGMLLIFVQKLCTQLHEYGPASEAGVLNGDSWSFLKSRILKRIAKVADVANSNELGGLNGIAELAALRMELESASTPPDVMELAKRVHQINHKICDELEKII